MTGAARADRPTRSAIRAGAARSPLPYGLLLTPHDRLTTPDAAYDGGGYGRHATRIAPPRVQRLPHRPEHASLPTTAARIPQMICWLHRSVEVYATVDGEPR